MNLPNKLTIARLVLTVVFVVMFYVPSPIRETVAMLVFGAASLTDYFDGEIARRRGLVTNFGKLMDPLADKILMCAALVLLSAEDHVIPAWAVVIVMAREFFVTGIRLIASSQGAVLAAEGLGKHKTAWQMITVIYFLLQQASLEPLCRWLQPVFAWWPTSPPVLGALCITMMVALTLISGLSYFWKNRQLFDDA
jgi:CDP-diacylglycerol--glycerol-3-phosphate 3-phosphatidyltransferase